MYSSCIILDEVLSPISLSKLVEPKHYYTPQTISRKVKETKYLSNSTCIISINYLFMPSYMSINMTSFLLPKSPALKLQKLMALVTSNRRSNGNIVLLFMTFCLIILLDNTAAEVSTDFFYYLLPLYMLFK